MMYFYIKYEFANKSAILYNYIKGLDESMTDLKREEIYSKLKKQYLEIYKVSEDLYKENIHIYYEYNFIFGPTFHRRFYLYYMCERNTKKIDILLDKFSNKEEININEVENDLDILFADLIRKVNLIEEEYKQAKVFLNIPEMSEAEAKELVEMFTSITNYIHPNLREQNDEIKKLWRKSVNAYRNNDLRTLRSCRVKIDELGIELPKEKSKNIDYEKMIKVFKENIEILTSKNTYLINSFPYDQKDILKSKELIDKKIKEVEADIELFVSRLEDLEEMIEGILSINQGFLC